MKVFGAASIAAAALSGALFATSVTADLPPIVIKGSHFFYENGTEFFIRGVAYQQDVSSNGTTSTDGTFTDPLADAAGCQRDVPILKELGTNVIRVYAINSSLDHSACMSLLQENGIYLIQDLSNPSDSINRNSPEWNTDLFASYASVVDALANYTNVLGFFAGNEVSNDVNNTNASAFVKAAVRDMKAYIKTKNYRSIGVGYATNDDANIRINLADYFNCGDSADSIDFWGYNIYSWCGDSSYTLSGYDQRTAEFANYSVPAFFAEYGCNTVQPRLFTEVQAIYGENMTGVWSGGIVYMYFQEANDYGLVSISGTTASKLPDFTALSNQLASATPSSTLSSDYTVTNTVAQACPATGTAWAAASALPPIANSDVCSCMVSSLTCIANTGLSGNETATLFSTVCGLDANACAGIAANGTTGVYGAYSMCSSYQQLSFAFDQYYQSQNKASTACSFGGNAKIQTGSTSSTCKSLLSQAGSAGTGTVTTVPTGTGSGSSSGSSSSSTSSKTNAAGATIVPRLDIGLLQLGAYVLVADRGGRKAVRPERHPAMARVVMEDSDDEFPDLATLLASSKKNGVKAKSINRFDGKLESRDEKSSEANPKLAADATEKREKGITGETKPKKPMKRVLNQKTENPLLRPISRTTGSSKPLGEKSRPRPEGKEETESRTHSKRIRNQQNTILNFAENFSVDELESKSMAITSSSELLEQKPSSRARARNSDHGEDLSEPTKTKSKLAQTVDNNVEILHMRSKQQSRKEPSLEPVEGESPTELRGQGRARHAAHPAQAKRIPNHIDGLDNEDKGLLEDSDGLSGFVVNDSTCLDEEGSLLDLPAPRSTRKLIQGRRKSRRESSDSDLEFCMKKLIINNSQNESDDLDDLCMAPRAKSRNSSNLNGRLKTQTKRKIREEARPKKSISRIEGRKTSKSLNMQSFNTDNQLLGKTQKALGPVDGLQEFNKGGSGSEKRGNNSKETKPSIEVPKATKKLVAPSSDIEDPFTLRFTTQQPGDKTSNSGIPKETPTHTTDSSSTQPKPQLDKDNNLSEGALLFSPTKKSPVKQNRIARDAKKAFSEKKHALAEAFLQELDQTITNGQVSRLAASSGGVRIVWSKKLNTTAGRANWKRETIKSTTQPDGKAAPPSYRHHASIELAEKVIDDEDRLLNVIAHEFCHLANFMVSNIKTNPHGKEFKAWAAKCSRHFGHRGIEVTTKHSYSIDYKYIWECVNCGIEFKRHSKSIDPARHQCGSCKCKLTQTKPVPRARAGTGKIGDYHVFVKENMKKIREENPGSPQKDIMGLIGKRYQEYKASKLGEKTERVGVDEVVGSKAATPENDDMGFVVRKLDFLDLTSP
ncbi:hypothetical protein G7Y89_g10865 [Cudoniella acicularis]|uniref:1,3-beta-glucanosyltransferase n=1 Tax=Cudoniella acicularis TaxID=354080 RepID=A0A8H4RBY4_9HELO|nr:hypothetical protein G7Y89_g10865 [Cudoniella acicularis]